MSHWNDASPLRPGTRNLRVLWSLQHFLRPYRHTVLIGMLGLLLGAGAILAFGVVLRQWIDAGLGSQDPGELNRVLLLLMVAIVTMAVGAGIRIYFVAWLGERVVADLRQAVFRNVIRLDPAFYERTRIGEVISRLTADTLLIQTIVGFTLAIAIRNLVLLFGGLILLLLTSPMLAFWLLLGLPLVALPVAYLGRHIRRLSRATQDGVAAIGERVDESLNAIQTVQSCAQEPAECRRYSRTVEAAFQHAIRRAAAGAWLAGLVIVLMFMVIAGVLWLGGHAVLAGELTAGELAAFLFYAVLVAGSVAAFSEVVSELMRGAGAAERLVELLEVTPRITVAQPAQAWLTPRRGAIRLQGVQFAYPTRPVPAALHDIHLEIAPGTAVALVGPSGAGKSTLFQLLLRFHDPDAGSLQVDGIDLRHLDPGELRRHVALVPQQPVLFAGTIRENIAYARPDASTTELLAAARAAHILEFAERLPDGLDTALGERGVRLSGGQRARVALARAFLQDPTILLLDEATSALDAESERLVQDALRQISRGRTTLMIAHRLATVLAADRILVMDRGTIVGDGTHHELLQRGGLYAHLAALQHTDN
jgi:ATP-binding cassette subfamily B protein